MNIGNVAKYTTLATILFTEGCAGTLEGLKRDFGELQRDVSNKMQGQTQTVAANVVAIPYVNGVIPKGATCNRYNVKITYPTDPGLDLKVRNDQTNIEYLGYGSGNGNCSKYPSRQERLFAAQGGKIVKVTAAGKPSAPPFTGPENTLQTTYVLVVDGQAVAPTKPAVPVRKPTYPAPKR